MSSRVSEPTKLGRNQFPTQDNPQQGEEKPEVANSVAAAWDSGIRRDDVDESGSVIISCGDSGSSSSSLVDDDNSSNLSENYSASDASQNAWGNREVTKMNTRLSSLVKEDHVAANAPQSHQHPSKFCLTGTGTSLGFSAAVAGFTATAFLYDLMTRFPEKASTEIGVMFGASIAIALGGTITCSTSMVFMIRELCKTNSG